MKHVFVESNWVYGFCSPRHRRKPEAQRLRERAERGDLRVYIPGICLREGSEAVRRRCQPRFGNLGDYRRSAEQRGVVSAEDAAVVMRFFDQYERDVVQDLDEIDARLDRLRATHGVEAFALSETMLDRVLQLRASVDEVSRNEALRRGNLGSGSRPW